MRKIGSIIFVSLMFIASANVSRAADVFPLKVDQLAPNLTQVSNAADVGDVTIGAQYTPDGKYLIVTASGEFSVIPVEKLDEGIENLDQARAWKGVPSAYLPSGKIVFSTPRGLSALDPATEKVRAIYELPESEIDPERTYQTFSLTVISDDLLIGGDGDASDGSLAGNVLRFEVNRGRRTRGAAVPGFYNPQLSPNRRFIFYENGNRVDTGYAEIYDVVRDARLQIARRFNLKRAFPKYKNIVERPVAWTGADTFLAEVEDVDKNREISEGAYISDRAWLVLFNAATGRIVWKTLPMIEFGGSGYHQLSATKMLIDTVEGKLYELSLANGKVKPLPNLSGGDFAVSADKKRLAYFSDAAEVSISALDGSGKRKVLDIPKSWKFDQWSRSRPLWSPDGKRLIVLGRTQFMFVRL